MTGRHARDDSGTTLERYPLVVPTNAAPLGCDEMPDPDNLRVDLATLPFTGPIELPRR